MNNKGLKSVNAGPLLRKKKKKSSFSLNREIDPVLSWSRQDGGLGRLAPSSVSPAVPERFRLIVFAD